MTTLTWNDLPSPLRMSDEVMQLRAAMHVGKSIRIIAHPTSKVILLARLLHNDIPIKERTDCDREMGFVYRLAGMNKPGYLDFPFRAPHHTISVGAIRGCAGRWRPGELSLAHGGTLLLDELPEFQPQVLRLVAQVLEKGRVVWAGPNVARMLRLPTGNSPVAVGIPAAFRLIGIQRPCLCGWHGYEDDDHTCNCNQAWVERYLERAAKAGLEFDLTVRLPGGAA
jgi:magnesium chelatase family protein